MPKWSLGRKKTPYILNMNEVAMMHEAEPKKILQTAVDKKVPATMSYLSKGKWHISEVLLANLEAEKLNIESTGPQKEPNPINIQVNQPVGISFRYEYGKFVFDTIVVTSEPAPEPAGQGVALAVPDRLEAVERRSYFRVNVPESLKINALLWHRRSERDAKNRIQGMSEGIHNYCKGRLVDISAGGARVVISHPNGVSQDSFRAATADFKKGQFVGMRFTPMPYETPLVLNAQIRNVLQTADGKSTSLGLHIVGLEASPEGRRVLNRLISVVQRYYQINQSHARWRRICSWFRTQQSKSIIDY
jgi:hypothetical protein